MKLSKVKSKIYTNIAYQLRNSEILLCHNKVLKFCCHSEQAFLVSLPDPDADLEVSY